jgi:hypothetical protein
VSVLCVSLISIFQEESMFSRSRFIGAFICILLGGSAMFAQDKDRKDRDSDDRSNHRESDRECDRNHPRTSPLDYLFLPGFPGSRNSNSIAFGGTINVVGAMPFHLDRYFRVGHASLSITVPEPGSHAYVGIYDAHGNLLVQGKFPTDEAADLTIEISPRVLLKPGMYYFSIGAEGGTAQAEGYLFDTGDLGFTHSGLAANPIVDGSLPATLGTVTPPLLGSTPSAVFTQ